MKRPKKNFVVEYKGGSRRLPQKPASIWRNLDLKSISRDVQVDATSNDSLLPTNPSGHYPHEKQDTVAPLTAAPHEPRTVAPIQEEYMAEEAMTVSPNGVAESNTSPAPERLRVTVRAPKMDRNGPSALIGCELPTLRSGSQINDLTKKLREKLSGTETLRPPGTTTGLGPVHAFPRNWSPTISLTKPSTWRRGLAWLTPRLRAFSCK